MDFPASFDKYLQDLSNYEPLTLAEEQSIIQKIKTGCQGAKDLLATRNLRLVVTIAGKYRNTGVSFPDLVAEGNIGLLKAVDRFRDDKGAKFSTYAAYWIKQQIRHAINTQARLVRLPAQAYASLKKINESLKEGEEIGPDHIKDLAKKHNKKEKVMRSLMTVGNFSTVSIDANYDSSDTSSPTLGDIISDEKELNPEEEFMQIERFDILKEVFKSDILSEREKNVLKWRYGIEDKAQTLEEISLNLKLTRERVRQIQFIALDKIKRYFRKLENA